LAIWYLEPASTLRSCRMCSRISSAPGDPEPNLIWPNVAFDLLHGPGRIDGDAIIAHGRRGNRAARFCRRDIDGVVNTPLNPIRLSGNLLALLGNHSLKIRLGDCRGLPGPMRKVLVDAGVGKSGARIRWVFSKPIYL
jgi:hypothetical protein